MSERKEPRWVQAGEVVKAVLHHSDEQARTQINYLRKQGVFKGYVEARRQKDRAEKTRWFFRLSEELLRLVENALFLSVLMKPKDVAGLIKGDLEPAEIEALLTDVEFDASFRLTRRGEPPSEETPSQHCRLLGPSSAARVLAIRLCREPCS